MGTCFGKPVDDDKMRSLRRTATNKPNTTPPAAEKGNLSRNYYSHNEKGLDSKGTRNGVNNIPARALEAQPPTGEIVKPNLKMFTLDELKSATRNFRPDTVLGEGGFGRVFRGWIDPNTFKPSKVGVGIPVAVKKSNPDSLQGLEEWQSEVEFLGKFSHPNLVKLLGYCWEENQFLLVYEYMQKGSLETHLFERGPEPLSWDMRLKIAIGAARGLAFLHTSENSVIYRDFKSSNILLDVDYTTKLSDFGLAKSGPDNGRSHITTRVMGTYGYAAPEYIATGHLYVKSDVYGFGVVLLEMLTGLRALDPSRPQGMQNLVDGNKASLRDKKKLRLIIDARMGGQYSLTSAFQVAQLILKCVESEPKNRPCMREVLADLEKAHGIKYKPKTKKAGAVHQTNRRFEGRSPIHYNYNYNRGDSKSITRSHR